MQFIHICIFISGISFAEWVELPQIKPNEEAIITITPQKSSVREVFGVYEIPSTQIFSLNSTTFKKKIAGNQFENKTSENTKKENENPFKGYATFLTLLKNVQNSLMKNARKNTKSKLQVLKQLRNNLLINIEDRINQLWPMESNKEARDYGSHESHVDFPSNEGALITIGFLTLAVFLVKLVLNVISIIKYKAQYYNATGITTTVVFGRRKRAVDDDQQSLKILELIDTYEYNAP